MIQVRVRRGSEGEITAISAHGHANYAPAGEDIVCAAVTNLFATIYSALTDLLDVDVDLMMAEGELLIEVHDTAVIHQEQVQLLLRTCLLGLEQLSLSYEAYVQVQEEK